MAEGKRFLTVSTLGLAAAINARKPIARTGPLSVPAFAFGLPASELPVATMAATAGLATSGLLFGAHRTKAGKLALALGAATIANLEVVRREQKEADALLEAALVDELGADYRNHMAPAPMVPRPDHKPFVLPATRVVKRHVHHGHLSYGPAGPRNQVDIWARQDTMAGSGAPVLIQVHGGAWMVGDKRQNQAYPLMAHLAERGWVCVSISYRLSPRATWPDHIVDVKSAIGWVKANIADYGGDPGWIAITGGSAGGHLSSLAALTPNDPNFQPGFEEVDTSVRCAVPFYGVYDWTNRDGTSRADMLQVFERQIVKLTYVDNEAIYDQASPMSHVRPDAVPMFFIHGTNDSLAPVEQARSMVDLLRKESSNPVVYAELPGAQHAFDLFGSSRTWATVDAVERFLNVIRARG